MKFILISLIVKNEKKVLKWQVKWFFYLKIQLFLLNGVHGLPVARHVIMAQKQETDNALETAHKRLLQKSKIVMTDHVSQIFSYIYLFKSKWPFTKFLFHFIGLTDWTSWSTCSKTCDYGSQTRNRQCSGDCSQENLTEKQHCHDRPCKLICST